MALLAAPLGAQSRRWTADDTLALYLAATKWAMHHDSTLGTVGFHHRSYQTRLAKELGALPPPWGCGDLTLAGRKNAPNRLEFHLPRIDADTARVFTRTFSRVSGPPGIGVPMVRPLMIQYTVTLVFHPPSRRWLIYRAESSRAIS